MDTYYSNASVANLHTIPQMQAVNANAPLLARDPATGQFKLIFGITGRMPVLLFFNSLLMMEAPAHHHRAVGPDVARP